MRFLLPIFIVAALVVTAPASASAASSKTPSKELKRLFSSGQIDATTYNADLATYNSAKKTLKTLKSTRKTQLAAVIKNTDYIAAKGKFTATRIPAVFLTLETNRVWWSTKGLLANGARPVVPGSVLTWQYYAGQGLQIQWLGTFGNANSYYKSGQNTKLKTLLDQIVALGAQRANGIAWEYLFKFDGGSPPWVSGMAQATAIQAFARAAQKYSNPAVRNNDIASGQRYLATAKAALGIFKSPPPEGVRVDTTVGAHYLQYSFSRSLRIQNAFTQTVVGLHDFAQLGDPEGLALYLQGDAQLRAETPTYDTGAWSKYSNTRENNLSYHNLTIGFLKTLCQYQTADDAAAVLPNSGGVAPGGIPPLDPSVYCNTESNYRLYLKTKPVIALKSTTLKKGKNSKLSFTLSKLSNVSITVRRAGTVIYSRTVQVGYGTPSVKIKAAKSGTADVTLIATDMAGNKSTATGAVTIRP